jgi:glutamine---fructose-6-phosphate transaminase (isomerizing)
MSATRMRREIEEQPAALERTLAALVPLAPDIRALAGDCRQVLFIARGSSDNAAVYGQYLCAIRAGRLATLASPSVATAYHARVALDGVLAVAISQSGRTEEIVDTLAWARRGGATTLAICNQPDAPLARAAQLALVTQAGPERAVPATKTYTTQLAAVAILGLALAADNLPDGLARVPEAVERALGTAPVVEELAARLTYVQRLVVSARGYAFSTARELALKLEEACHVSAIGLSYADLLHGPIAVVDASTPAVLVAAERDAAVLGGMTLLARRCAEAGGHVYGIGGDAAFRAACRMAVPGSDLPAELAPIPLMVPGQLLAEALARAKGLDPDAPRGLRKVTQTA